MTPFPDDFVGHILPFTFVRSTFWRMKKPAIYRLMMGLWDAELYRQVFLLKNEDFTPLEKVLQELELNKT
ncbi:MAG: hypothetical protein PWP76_58 [Candidatus Diapherotrites archaeon]|nr:hypothetical protein [Candidatus Diapherotrites archaeon]MDN5366963.1 hypothetical protein [Candidatus Diapherotrites archaeon]